MNKKFKCTKCNLPDEDNSLFLIVTRTETTMYEINDDGKLEHYDNRDCDQEMMLECQICGAEYEFDSNLLVVEESPTLRRYIKNYSDTTNIINLDLSFNTKKSQ